MAGVRGWDDGGGEWKWSRGWRRVRAGMGGFGRGAGGMGAWEGISSVQGWRHQIRRVRDAGIMMDICWSEPAVLVLGMIVAS